MAQLIVRNLEEDLVRRLKARARENNRSTEEEHRLLLRAALAPESSDFASFLASIPEVGDDSDFDRSADTGRTIDL